MKTAQLSFALLAALSLSTAPALAADPPAAPPGSAAKAPAAPPSTKAPSAPPGSAAKAPAAPSDPGEPDAAPTSGAPRAPAAPATGGVAPSRVLFEAGAKAYSAGNYRAAIQAFEQAYGLEARPGLLFSMAQAHRRQYRVDGRPGHVAVAIRRYEEYLAAQRTGGRRTEAEAALAELRPIAQGLEAEGRLQPLAAQEIERATRLIVTSPVPGATIALDGDTTPRAAPLIVELPPGRHKIRVSAKAHFDEEREIEVASGGVTALDLPLREKPSFLTVTAVPGARVSLDGRFAGETPLSRPLQVDSGHHEVQIQKAGHFPYSKEVEIGPGEQATIEGALPLTFQRKLSVGLLIGGGAAVAGGVVLGGLALAQQGEAGAIKADMDQGKVVCRGKECPELDRYTSALSARDGLRAGAFALAGVGVAAAGAGLFYYLFDGAWPFAPADDRAAPGAPRASLTLSGVPLVAPGFGGAALSGEF